MVIDQSDVDDDNDGIDDAEDSRPSQRVPSEPRGLNTDFLDRHYHQWIKTVEVEAIALTAPALCQLPAHIASDLKLPIVLSHLGSGYRCMVSKCWERTVT